MNVVVSQQGLAFFASIVVGLCAAFLFHLLRIIRKRLFKNRGNPFLYDLFFWLVVLGSYVVLFFAYTYNITHLYTLFGMVCGAVFYQLFINRLIAMPILTLTTALFQRIHKKNKKMHGRDIAPHEKNEK